MLKKTVELGGTYVALETKVVAAVRNSDLDKMLTGESPVLVVTRGHQRTVAGFLLPNTAQVRDLVHDLLVDKGVIEG
jgi:hypothetical protein